MKKFFLVLTLLLSVFLLQETSVHAEFRFNYDTKDTSFYMGVRHDEMIGTIQYNGTESLQKINYLGANVLTNDNLHIVTGDNYMDIGWGRGTVMTMINNINNDYPNYTVIGGVNGDFYSATGYPIEAYVHNFEVLTPGLGYERTVIGFKDNGEVVFGRPCWEGHELIVYDEDGNIKDIRPIDGINRKPFDNTELTVYFDDISGTVTGDVNKVVLTATNIKIDDYSQIHFGKGVLDYETTGDVPLEAQRLILVGVGFNDDDLITATDRVVIQQHMGCDFEGVRYAIGGWEKLVEDGVAMTSFPSSHSIYRHPRTAIGVKADGTVFFVTVDGRDYVNDFYGVTNSELAEIMLYFDAVEAYNLDGGGSTTMIWYDETAEDYAVLNTPSDGNLRPVSNGVFIVIGEHDPAPARLPWPDTRQTLLPPDVVTINQSGLLDFGDVAGASGYDVLVNGEPHRVTDSELALDLEPGIYEFQIRSRGDTTDYKTSDYSDTFTYTIFPDRINDLLERLKLFTREETSE